MAVTGSFLPAASGPLSCPDVLCIMLISSASLESFMESDTGEEVYEYVSQRLCLGRSSPGSPNSQADALLANPPRGGCFRASPEPGTPVSPNAQTCPTRQERKPSPLAGLYD